MVFCVCVLSLSQLESIALPAAARQQIKGSVLMDSTVGSDTFFVVTWTAQKPEIVLQDPKGKTYRGSDFKNDTLNMRSARLQIPGIAEVSLFFSLRFINPSLC